MDIYGEKCDMHDVLGLMQGTGNKKRGCIEVWMRDSGGNTSMVSLYPGVNCRFVLTHGQDFLTRNHSLPS
jgi:hypothetical protein